MKHVCIQNFFHEASNTVCHVIWDDQQKQCAVIDAALDYDASSGKTSTQFAETVLAFITQNNLQLKYLLETHVHADHLSAAPFLRSKTSAPIMIGADTALVEEAFEPIFALRDEQHSEVAQHYFDRLLTESDELPLGQFTIAILKTPGHTAGCVTYCVDNAAFVGDTLFMPDFGTARADFPGGDARTLYRSIQKILALPDTTRLFMCHDYMAKGRSEYAWETTVAEQRQNNIHLRDGVQEDQFVAFRTERDSNLSMPKLLLPSVQVNLRAGNLPKAAKNGVQYLKIPLNQF